MHERVGKPCQSHFAQEPVYGRLRGRDLECGRPQALQHGHPFPDEHVGPGGSSPVPRLDEAGHLPGADVGIDVPVLPQIDAHSTAVLRHPLVGGAVGDPELEGGRAFRGHSHPKGFPKPLHLSEGVLQVARGLV